MKKIIISTIILGMAATTAIADVLLTVVHSKDADFREEIKTQAAEQNVVVTEVTHLTVICEEDAVLKESDLVGANTTNPEEIAKFIRTADFFKNKLVKADFYQAVFQNNDLTGSYYDGDKGMLSGCLSLQEVILPDGLETITGGSFKNCAKLVTVRLPESIKTIGVNAFRDCPLITFNSLPASLERIGNNAFASTNGNNLQGNVKIGEFPSGLKYIEPNAFNNTNVFFSEFPEGLISIGATAFRNTNVTFKEFPKSLTTLEPSAFVNCGGITEFTIPELLWEKIPDRTFYWGNTNTNPRVFYCRSITPPEATYDTSGTNGTFGNAAEFPNVTFYVPLGSEEDYKNQLPYSKMNIQTLMFEKEKALEDIFDVQCNDYQDYVDTNLEWKEVVNKVEQDVKFDREGVYTLRITPKDNWTVQATYIKEIRFASDDSDANEDDDQVDIAPDSPNANADITYMKPRKAPGDVLYSAEDPTSKPVDVEVPIFVDSPKVIVELYSTHVATGVESIVDESDNFCRVYNIAGVCVYSGENVDTNSLPAGTYIVKTRNKTTKIVK